MGLGPTRPSSCLSTRSVDSLGRSRRAQLTLPNAQTFILDVPTTSSADFDSSVDPASASLADRPRTWWFSEARDGQAHYRRLDETLEYLRGILENEGPFDGCWGFSQGAAMAGILTLLVENPALHPVFAAPATHGSTNWPPPQFKFAILGAGFEPQDSVVGALSDFTTPTSQADLRTICLGQALVYAKLEWESQYTVTARAWKGRHDRGRRSVETRSPSRGAPATDGSSPQSAPFR